MSDQAERWLAVPAASAETGVKERTLFRWAKAKRVPARKEAGVTLVEVGAVRVAAAARDTAKPPAASGTTAVSGGGTGNGGGSGGAGAAQPIDGAMASKVFAALLAGRTAVEIVRDDQIRPDIVRTLQNELRRLQEGEQGKGPTVAARLGDLAEEVKRLEGVLGNLELGADAELAGLKSRLLTLEKAVAAIPRPYCGTCGQQLNSILLTCKACGDMLASMSRRSVW